MHKNFSNQLERHTALDSPADVEAVLTRQRRTCLQHKNEEKTCVRARGILKGEGGLEDSENTGSR